MKAFVLSLFALSGCAAAVPPASIIPPEAEVRPVTTTDRLDGRWTVAAVNQRQVSGLWLELSGVRTSYNLGCNIGGGELSRNGDKLFIDKAFLTERGCDAAREGTEQQAIAILRAAMTMELTEPNRLRLVNEFGTIDLVRVGEVK